MKNLEMSAHFQCTSRENYTDGSEKPHLREDVETPLKKKKDYQHAKQHPKHYAAGFVWIADVWLIAAITTGS